MSELVTCRVCGLESPLGTLECPDCGAPLPQALERTLPEAVSGPEGQSPAEQDPSELPAALAAPPKKKGWRRFIAAAVAVCLVAGIAAVALWPRKPEPVGVAYAWEDKLVTPEGVWDYGAAGLALVRVAANGAGALLRELGDADEDGTTTYWGTSSLISSSAPYVSWGVTATGDYFVFDGRKVERTAWNRADMTDNGMVFYAVEDGETTVLGRRDLATGREVEIDRMEGPGTMNSYVPAPDGSALVYQWEPEGEDVEGRCRLWTQKGSVQELTGCPGRIWDVGCGGRVCIFYVTNDIVYGTYGERNGASVSRDYYYLWTEGETAFLPGGMRIVLDNADNTEFLLRDTDEETWTGEWYYYRLGEEPVALDIPIDSYLYPVLWNRTWATDALGSLTGQFYQSYLDDGASLFYLDSDAVLHSLPETLSMDECQTSEDGGRVLYKKDGELYLAEASADGGYTIQTITQTETPGISYEGKGTVYAYAADPDLKHIYYFAQGDPDYYPSKVLSHWHDGETTTSGFEISSNNGTPQMTVTGAGECYLIYQNDLYYASDRVAPNVVLEDVNAQGSPQRVGEQGWLLLTGRRYEGSKNKDVYWLLNGNKLPVELPEWQAEEETP